MITFKSNSEHVAAGVAALRAAFLREKPNVQLFPGYRDYVNRNEDNLFAPELLTRFETAFNDGAGGELRNRKKNGKVLPAKMKAMRSSSALALNVFGPIEPHRSAITIRNHGGFRDLKFEEPFDADVGRTPPHLDVFLTGQHGSLAIEVKCLEYLSRPSNDFADAYGEIPESDPRRGSPWFTHMREISNYATAIGMPYRHLHAAQLIKHYFGLARDPRTPITLLYLYWEPTNRESIYVARRNSERVNPYQAHRQEIAQFSRAVAGDRTTGVRFESMPLLDLWREWTSANAPDWLTTHVASLQRRYQVAISQSAK